MPAPLPPGLIDRSDRDDVLDGCRVRTRTTMAERARMLESSCRMAAELTAQHRDLRRVLDWQDPLSESISPAVAAEVASLPRAFPREPADRIIVATARVLGATLLTSDGGIVESELVPTLS